MQITHTHFNSYINHHTKTHNHTYTTLTTSKTFKSGGLDATHTFSKTILQSGPHLKNSPKPSPRVVNRYFPQTLALGCLPMVSLRIPAVVVSLVRVLHPPHRRVLLAAQPGTPWGRGGGRAARGGAGPAAAHLEIGVPTNEGLVVVVGLVPSVFGGPWRGVPYRSVHIHGP